MKTIRIGSRSSALALVQAETVKFRIETANPGLICEIKRIRTAGDVLRDEPLSQIGGKGVFVKEIERCLLDGEIDLAVHSLKDLPSQLPEGLMLGACLARDDARDMLFAPGKLGLDELPSGARVGSSSLRRVSQLKALRPDLEPVAIRGNVPTRLAKLGSEVDAVILSAAGVLRLAIAPGVALEPAVMVPSPGQGVIAVECRAQDAAAIELVAPLECATTRRCIEAERAFLAALGQDCRLPAGAYAELVEDEIEILGFLADESGASARLTLRGSDAAIGRELAEQLKTRIAGGAPCKSI